MSQRGGGGCAPFLCGCTAANDTIDTSIPPPSLATPQKSQDRQLPVENNQKLVSFSNNGKSNDDYDDDSLEFIDAFEGNDEEWQGVNFVSDVPTSLPPQMTTPSENTNVGRASSPASFASAKSIYFDAEEYDRVSLYPPIVSTKVPPSPNVSMERPRSLCRSDEGGYAASDYENDDDNLDDEIKENVSKEKLISDLAIPSIDEETKQQFEKTSKLIREKSKRYQAGELRQARRSTMAIRKELETPGVVLAERGFPGQLDTQELEKIQIFRKELQRRDPVYQEIVYQFVDRDVEEEAYALCRFLRARKYEPGQVFELLDQGKDIWKVAQKTGFYPDVEEAMGVSLALFSRMYPFVYHGNAKNGCPVAYLKAGQLDANAVRCIITMKQVYAYFWNQYMHVLPLQLAQGKASNPDFVRCECVQIMDLKGFSRAQITDTAIEVVKISGHITTCFPETLHCLVIINAPGIFSFAWSLVKKFIDPRTASKVEIYSNAKEGKKRIAEIIETKDIPSDYDGTSPSLSTLLENVGVDPDNASKPRIRFTDLMHIRKNKKSKYEFELDGKKNSNGENFTLTVYTNCAMGATFAIYHDDSLLEEVEVSSDADGSVTEHISNVQRSPSFRKKRKGNNDNSGPYSIELMSSLPGHGKIRLEGKSLGTDGYFLIVCESIAMA